MPKDKKTVLVKPLQGQALTYEVESWTNPTKPHIVTLTENDGNGYCTCRDFITRRQPAIDNGAKLFTRDTSCRHVIAARNHFLTHTLRDIAQRMHPKKGHHALDR